MVNMEKTKTKTKTTTKKTTKTPAKRTRAKKDVTPKNLAPDKLMLLVTIVNRNKAEYYADLLQSFEVNMQMAILGRGTAKSSFGLLNSDWEKAVLFSVIRKDNVKKALDVLEEKFASIRGGKGISCVVPLSSVIGVAVYQFLSNKQS